MHHDEGKEEINVQFIYREYKLYGQMDSGTIEDQNLRCNEIVIFVMTTPFFPTK